MNKNLLRSLAILALALSASQSQMSMGQSNPDHGSGGPYLIDVRHRLDSMRRSAASASLNTRDRAGALGARKIKAYRFRSIDYPGATDSGANDSNGHTIVGEFSDSATTYARAFYLTRTTYYTVNIPGAIESFFVGINTPGQMVGNYYDSSEHGFVYDGKDISTFDVPGSYGSTDATDISDSGVIVGDYFDNFLHQHGFVDKDGVFTTLDFPGATRTFAAGINSSGAIVGAYIDTAGEHGFLLNNGVYSAIDFPLSIDTAAFGVNDGGDVTGTFIDANHLTHGFIYSSGAFRQVDVNGAAETYLYRMAKDGTVVGYILDGLREAHGIVGH
jgi:uncharacterized membrane protein